MSTFRLYYFAVIQQLALLANSNDLTPYFWFKIPQLLLKPIDGYAAF